MRKISILHAPVNYSSLYTIIPEKDEIFYSTICDVYWKKGVYGGVEHRSWNAHVILTRSVFAYTSPLQYTNKELNMYYWNKISVRVKKNNEVKFQGKIFTDLRSDSTLANFCRKLPGIYRIYLREMNNYKIDIEKKFAEDGYSKFIGKVVPFMVSGYYYMALDIFDKVLKIIPEEKGSEIWFYKGEALNYINRKEEARNCYEKALKINPKNSRAMEKIIELQTKMNLEAISSTDRKRAGKLLLKGNKEFDKKNYEKALEFYEEALKLNPYNITIWNKAGSCLEGLKNDKKAIEYYVESLKLKPNDNDVLGKLQRIRLDLAKYGDNIIFCDNCGKMLPNDAKFCKECGSKVENE